LSSAVYCAYDNDQGNADTYGYLYSWYAVNDSRNIAPEGWHVPTEGDWNELEQYLGMNTSAANMTGWRGIDEGNKMKSTTGWGADDNGTNESGFALVPGGMRGNDSIFSGMGGGGYYWSSSRSSSYAWSRYLASENSRVFRYSYLKGCAFTVRLIKD